MRKGASPAPGPSPSSPGIDATNIVGPPEGAAPARFAPGERRSTRIKRLKVEEASGSAVQEPPPLPASSPLPVPTRHLPPAPAPVIPDPQPSVYTTSLYGRYRHPGSVLGGPPGLQSHHLGQSHMPGAGTLPTGYPLGSMQHNSSLPMFAYYGSRAELPPDAPGADARLTDGGPQDETAVSFGAAAPPPSHHFGFHLSLDPSHSYAHTSMGDLSTRGYEYPQPTVTHPPAWQTYYPRPPYYPTQAYPQLPPSSR